jgi:enediyne core biosynthesis thioesterase
MPIINVNGKNLYEYRLIPSFEETNLVGNVYFANYVLWQGKCREMFLYEYCPDVIEEISNGLLLITLDLSMQYISQLYAFDKVVMHMSLEASSTSRMLMGFEYFKEEVDGKLTLVSKGTQATLAMKEIDGRVGPVSFPESMFEVLNEYGILQ